MSVICVAWICRWLRLFCSAKYTESAPPNAIKNTRITPHGTVPSLPTNNTHPVLIEFSQRWLKVKRSPGLFPPSQPVCLKLSWITLPHSSCGNAHSSTIWTCPPLPTRSLPLLTLTVSSTALAVGLSKTTKAALDG
jgi:hypothetical protein